MMPTVVKTVWTWLVPPIPTLDYMQVSVAAYEPTRPDWGLFKSGLFVLGAKYSFLDHAHILGKQ